MLRPAKPCDLKDLKKEIKKVKKDHAKEAKKLAKSIFIAGGGEIYELALPFVKTVHISTLQTQARGDVYFPAFPTKDFILIEERKFESNINYVYQRFERRNQIINLKKSCQ